MQSSQSVCLSGDNHLLTRLMENLFLSTPNFLANEDNVGMALKTGITHIIMIDNGIKYQKL